MSEWLYAPVPRQIRVQAMLSLGGQRISLRMLILTIVLLFVWMVLVLMNCALVGSAQVCGVLGVIGYAVLEYRYDGISLPELARDSIAHLRLARVLLTEQATITLAPERTSTSAVARPRWQADLPHEQP